MKKFLLSGVALALIANAAAAGPSRETRRRISELEDQLGTQRSHQRLRSSDHIRDLRGRREVEDLEQWAFTDSSEARIEDLLKQARQKEDPDSRVALHEAQQLLQQARDRQYAINGYWLEVSAGYWRDRWAAFARANGIATADPSPEFGVAESALIATLEAGDFATAQYKLRTLNAQADAIMRTLRSERARSTDSATLKFIPRKTPCPSSDDADGKAVRMTRAADPEAFYPPASKRRNEQGSIAVRVRINEQRPRPKMASPKPESSVSWSSSPSGVTEPRPE